MRKDFIQTQDGKFVLNGNPVMLRGWALGSWMNLEHFMMGMPGTNSMIIETFEEVYGKENAGKFFDRLNTAMVTEDDIIFLKSIGTNTIRIPVGYHWLMSDDNPYEFLEDGFEKLDRVVRMCEKNSMYVILDLHSTPGGQNPDWATDSITGQALLWKFRCFQDQVVWLWSELSRRFAGRQWIAGYDVINEPGFGLTAEQINGLYQRIIDAVRENDRDHIIFLEGIDFGRDFTPLKDFDDEQIAFTVHFYPFVLEENTLDQEMDDAHRMEIFTRIFERQLGEVARFHRPIWCGETGYEIIDGQEEFYAMLLLHNISLCEERGISWNLWTYKDARVMGIVIPKRESRWRKLFDRIAVKWAHHREEKISMEAVTNIGINYYEPLSERFAYEMDFRIRSVLHRIGTEIVLKPILKTIPWEQIMEYADDFLFENCDQRTIVVERIKNYINTGNGGDCL